MTQAGIDNSPAQLIRGPRLLGTVAWACIALTALVAFITAVPVLRALSATAAVQASPLADKDLAARHLSFEGGLVVSDQRIDARAPFGITRPPVAPVVAEVGPTKYGGSPLVGVVNDTLILADGRRVGVGETVGDVTLVSLDLPWSVRVKWKNKELDEPLFARSTIDLEQPISAIIGALPYVPPPKIVAATPPAGTVPAGAPSAVPPPPQDPAASAPPVTPPAAPQIIQTLEGGNRVILTLPGRMVPSPSSPPPTPPDE
ncbi:MAG: hypothetical protein ACREJO_16485 [Phycisphaerales bacterium]